MGQAEIRIFDTTLRDGEQAPGFSLRPAEKLLLAHQLDALGVDIIEAGFPIASPADADAVRRIATEVRRPVIACLARCHRADLEKAAWALEPAERGRIHTFIATSDLHLQAKLRMSREKCLEAAVDSVRFARQHTPDVQFSAEDATRSDFDFLCRVVEAVIMPAPRRSTSLTRLATARRTKCSISFNGFAPAWGRQTRWCSARIATTTSDSPSRIRSQPFMEARDKSSAPSTESASAPATRPSRRSSWHSASAATGCRLSRTSQTKQIYPSSEMLTRLTGQGVQVNKAIVGRNAFAHEAGIHQDGMLKDRRTYEIFCAEDVGAPWNPLVLGKHSGRHAVQRRCADLGFQIEGDELIGVYRALMAIADDRKGIAHRRRHPCGRERRPPRRRQRGGHG